jgi:UDP-glucose 4-epimerase
LNPRKSRNLIIGSEGYIGSHLQKVIEAETLDIKGKPKWNINIRENINLKKEYDNVIILAALVKVGESEEIPNEYYKTNILGLMNILQSVKAKHFIFASSGAAVNPTSFYGQTKKIGEEIVEKFCKENNINYTIFRFYNVVGSSFGITPTNEDGLFYNLIKAKDTGIFTVFGNDYNTHDGTAIRDYVHVLDICNAIKKSVDNPSNAIESLGTGKGYSILEIISKFKEVNNLNFEVVFKERRQGDLESTVLNNVSSFFEKTFTIEETLKIIRR